VKVAARYEQKLDGMLAAKKDLEVQVEQQRAGEDAASGTEPSSCSEIDDSELTRVKKLIAELNKQLDVKEKMLDADGKFLGLIPVDHPAVEVPIEKVTEEINNYFKGDAKKAEQSPVTAKVESPAL
jgi:hypothetical protein